MSDYPVTKRTDVSPSKNPTAEKKHGESFNTAFNPPNNPTKNKRPNLPYNVNDGYCDEGGPGVGEND